MGATTVRRRVAAVLVVTASVGLLQVHGMQFWIEHAGKTGVVWSLTLEISAVYLWLHRAILPALLASALLVAGPLYQVASPALEQARKAEFTAVERVGEENKIKQLESSLLQYERNSEKRIGWAGRIDATQERLDAARERLRELVAKQGEYQRSWHKTAIVSMEAFALLVVLYSQIFALSRLREYSKMLAKDRRKDDGGDLAVKPEKGGFSGNSKITVPIESDTKDRVKMARRFVEAKLPDFDGKRQLLAQHIGVRLADLSLLKHHEKRRQEGRETISQKKLDKIITVLGGDGVVSSAV